MEYRWRQSTRQVQQNSKLDDSIVEFILTLESDCWITTAAS